MSSRIILLRFGILDVFARGTLPICVNAVLPLLVLPVINTMRGENRPNRLPGSGFAEPGLNGTCSVYPLRRWSSDVLKIPPNPRTT